MFVICSLNINGLISKQSQVIAFMKYNRIDVLLNMDYMTINEIPARL